MELLGETLKVYTESLLGLRQFAKFPSTEFQRTFNKALVNGIGMETFDVKKPNSKFGLPESGEVADAPPIDDAVQSRIEFHKNCKLLQQQFDELNCGLQRLTAPDLQIKDQILAPAATIDGSDQDLAEELPVLDRLQHFLEQFISAYRTAVTTIRILLECIFTVDLLDRDEILRLRLTAEFVTTRLVNAGRNSTSSNSKDKGADGREGFSSNSERMKTLQRLALTDLIPEWIDVLAIARERVKQKLRGRKNGWI